MRLYAVELRNVRQFRTLVLDLSSPLTVIGGPQGVGKSTVQKAVMASMFHVSKSERDSLKSRFDPDTPPTATLTLSRDTGAPTVTIVRRLTDDSGEWREGATVVKQKGAALARVQESLPISADAAAMLLWGLQEELAAVVEQFPSDGHTLLTAATIRGSGPDPKEFAQQLADESKRAKRTGQNPGALAQADQRVANLKEELSQSRAAQQHLADLERQYKEARRTAAEAIAKRDQLEQQGKQIKHLAELADSAVKALKHLGDLVTTQSKWDELEEEQTQTTKRIRELKSELAVLEAQHRVARDRELSGKIEKLEAQVDAAEAALKRHEEIKAQMKARSRPGQSDEDRRLALTEAMDQATNRMDASGVRYEVAATSEAVKVRIGEDNAAAKEVELRAGKPVEGVVGNVVVQMGAVRVAAAGKEDIASLKRTTQRADAELRILCKRFSVKDAAEMAALRAEQEELETALEKAETQVEKELKGATLASLKAEIASSRKAQQQNAVSDRDKREFGARHFAAASEIEKKIARKDGEIDTAETSLGVLATKVPTDTQKARLKSDLLGARRASEAAVADFKDVDGQRREPTEALLDLLRAELEKNRDDYIHITAGPHNPATEVARLETELRHAGPEHPLASIEADLQDAKAVLRQEQILEEARDLLSRRIEEEIVELAADVPRELGDKVSHYLARLTKGAYGQVSLTDALAVSGVREAGQTAEQWRPAELSQGERAQTALAVKIAVARALADATGPVFVVLDDSLVTFDPGRRTAAEDCLLDLASDGKLQVILLTCHTDWAADWEKRRPGKLRYIELSRVADYYRPPPAIVPL